MESDNAPDPVDGEPPMTPPPKKPPSKGITASMLLRANNDAGSSPSSSQSIKFPTEGSGTDIADALTVAESKQVTTANVDRWKRTFQAMRMAIRQAGKDSGGSQDDDVLYQRTLRSQATSVADEEALEHDIFEEITRRETTRSFGVISPDSIFKMIWDFAGLIFILIQSLVIPFKLGFSADLPYSWDMFEVAMDFYFMIDIGTTRTSSQHRV